MADEILAEQKSILRREMLARRRVFSAEERKDASRTICAHAAQLSALKAAQTIMLYASMTEEIDLVPFMESLLADGRRIVLPEITTIGTESFTCVLRKRDGSAAAGTISWTAVGY